MVGYMHRPNKREDKYKIGSSNRLISYSWNVTISKISSTFYRTKFMA